MFRGTAYAIGEIIWWCLASFIIGYLVGWIMRRWFLRDTLRREFETRLAGERANTARFQTALSDRDAEVTALLAEVKAQRQRSDSDDKDHAARIAELQRRVEELESTASTAMEDAARARTALAERQAEVASLASAAAGEEDAPDDAAPAPIAALPDIPTATSRSEAVAAMAEIAERTRAGSGAADDDLKLIRGIGPKIEGLLKGMGITSFRQVANLETSDIAIVAAALDSFPDRIERDDWMTGAAEQHRRKYGDG